MPIAVNDAGEAVYLNGDGQWEPARMAVNPQTQERLAFDGKDWQPIKTTTAPTGANDIVRSTARGVPIIGGLLNKADAATNATLAPLVEPFLNESADSLKQPTWAERYEKALGIQNRMDTKFDKEHPNVSTVAQVGGGVASMIPLGMTAAGARALGLTGGTLPQMMLRGGISNAGINAADAVTRGGDPLVSAGVGGVLGAAMPPAARAISAATAPVLSAYRGIMNPQGEAARRVATAIERDMSSGGANLTHSQFDAAVEAGLPVTMLDAGGETTRALARSAANTSPEGRAVLNQTINDRFEGQGNRTIDWLQQNFNYPDAISQKAAIDAAARQTNKAAYGVAQSAADERFPSGIWSSELERLTSSPDVVGAMKSAAESGKGRAVAEGYGGFNPGVTFDNGILNFRKGPTGVPSYPDLRFWDYAYRDLRDFADKAFRSGANSLGNSLKTQATQLRTELDKLVPEFGRARSIASSFFDSNDALEAGQKFVTSKMSNREAQAALLKMPPAERKLFQDGFVDRYIQLLRENPTRRTVISKVGGSDAADERLAIALGPQKARELEARMHVERVMDLARNAVQGNSTTARQLAELGLAGGAYELSGGNLSPESVMNAALVYGAAKGRGAIDRRVAEQVAKLLVSGKAGNVMLALKTLSQPKMLGALRVTDANLASLAARGAEPSLTNSPSGEALRN